MSSRTAVPEATDADLRGRYAGAMMNTFGLPKAVLASGDGARVRDVRGRRYVDLYAGLAVSALGHGHPALVAAVSTQLRTLGHISNFFASVPQIELAERLLTLLGAPEGRVFFTNSGSEANEAALKLTRRTGRRRLVAAEGSFHGRTMGALSLTSKASYREPFEPLPGEVEFVRYGDREALAAAVSDETAAVVLEPVQGEAGVIIPPAGYLAAAREITRRHGALLWLDEVQSGMGRTGTWFAHQNPVLNPAPRPRPDAGHDAGHDAGFGLIAPDIVTVAKGLAGGVPIGACLATGRSTLLLGPGQHGSTFGGNPVAAAAGLAVIETIEAEGLLSRSRAIGAKLASVAGGERVAAVRVAGAFAGIDLTGPHAPHAVEIAQEHGFLINSTGPGTIRLAPPFVISDDDLDHFCEAWPRIVQLAEETTR
ncbi:MAG: acetylornithine transaminase [Nocardioides sp.]